MTDGKPKKEHHIKMHWKSFAEKLNNPSDDETASKNSTEESVGAEDSGKDLSLDDNKNAAPAVIVQQ